MHERRLARPGLLAGLILAIFGLPALAQTVASNSQPTASIERADDLRRLVTDVPTGTKVALVIADADSGVVSFAHEADLPLKPASLQKLLVTAAALERFGPGFSFQTRAFLNGAELWIVGAGDPAIGDTRLAERNAERKHLFDQCVEALRTAEISTLDKIVLDDSVFERQTRHPDWPESQSDRWYQAPVGGLNVNDNCLDAHARLHGDMVILELTPDLPGNLFTHALTRGKPHRPVVHRPPDSDFFEFTGTVARNVTLRPVSVHRPTLFFAQALKHHLRKNHIKLSGDVVRRRLTDAELTTATPIFTHTTSLPNVVWRCNTFSQNLFAECLLKSLAAYEPDGRRSDVAGGWNNGRTVLTETLTGLGIDLSKATVRDGSGLSHSNRVTAATLVRLLVRMRHHPHASVFLDSLAKVGQPGTMYKRYDVPELRGRLRGKTGTLQNVRALAGLLTRNDNTELAFALLINGQASRDLPIRVCRVLIGTGDRAP